MGGVRKPYNPPALVRTAAPSMAKCHNGGVDQSEGGGPAGKIGGGDISQLSRDGKEPELPETTCDNLICITSTFKAPPGTQGYGQKNTNVKCQLILITKLPMPVAPVHPDGPALDPAITAKPTPAPLIVKAEVTVRPAAQSPEEARVTNLKQWCKQQHPHKVPYDQVSKSKLASIIVDERHKLLFCQIPGVALNDWRKIILILNGAVNASSTGSISGGDVFGKYAKSVKRLSEYDDKKRAEMLQNYYKVVFVRDPLERLVNAYKVKLNAKSSKYFHRAFGSPIIRKYRKNAKDKDIKDGSSVTFAEFTKYILDNEREGVINLNEHWQQYYKQCHPCLVDYDFVGTYEAVEKDTSTVLDKVSAKNMLKPPFVWDSKPATQKELNSVYSQVSPQDLNSLYKIYSADYTLFGYECPEYLHTLLQKGNVFHDY
ncbi:Carbohydrate sulfotransferase 11 [Bulinus truncatus]|nr:Carbohydrate sulfotransferase 11 [Bulinus truncatus]